MYSLHCFLSLSKKELTYFNVEIFSVQNRTETSFVLCEMLDLPYFRSCLHQVTPTQFAGGKIATGRID